MDLILAQKYLISPYAGTLLESMEKNIFSKFLVPSAIQTNSLHDRKRHNIVCGPTINHTIVNDKIISFQIYEYRRDLASLRLRFLIHDSCLIPNFPCSLLFQRFEQVLFLLWYLHHFHN